MIRRLGGNQKMVKEMNNQKLNAEILGVLMALGYNYISKIHYTTFNQTFQV